VAAVAGRARNGIVAAMRGRVLFAVLFGLVLGAPLLQAREPALRRILDALQKRYETTRTLTADFRQTVESPTLASPLESHGTVAFEKPNRMRWDYAPPDRQLIVGDGEMLWIYQPDEKQAIKAPLGEAFKVSAPVTFLAGLGRVERDFEATLEKEDGERVVLRLVPRQDSGVGTLHLVVRKSDAAVEEARITDPLGTTTRIAFSNERRNVALEPSLFRFTPPPGVDVVRPPAY
jgi:outer membrane lipoprotein carrier protein